MNNVLYKNLRHLGYIKSMNKSTKATKINPIKFLIKRESSVLFE